MPDWSQTFADMTFPIHPNNYNSMLPSPSHAEEPNVFSEGVRRVRLLRSAKVECLTIALVWIDIAMVTHQIVLDYSLSGIDVSNSTDRNDSEAELLGLPLDEFRTDHPALSSQASTALFIAITVMAFLFLLETIARNIYIRVSQKRFCIINISDAIVCAASFCLNLALLLAGVTPLARDFVALLITFRLVRFVTLFGGLTRNEKRQIVRMLDGYRREESFNAEHQRMLQTELENRTRECQDLRELVKSATLSRNRLKQKQQLQMQQQPQQQPLTDANTNEESCTDIISGYPTGSTGRRGAGPGGSVPDDSGHSSDASPDSLQEAFGRGLDENSPESPQIDIELAEVADNSKHQAAGAASVDRLNGDKLTSKM